MYVICAYMDLCIFIHTSHMPEDTHACMHTYCREVTVDCGDTFQAYNVSSRACQTNASFASSNTLLLSNAFEIVLVLYLLTAVMVFGDYAYLHRYLCVHVYVYMYMLYTCIHIHVCMCPWTASPRRNSLMHADTIQVYLFTHTYLHIHRRSARGCEAASQSSRVVWYFVLFQLITTVTFPLMYPQNYKVIYLHMYVSMYT
jgi:hypothetical protein